MRTDRIQANWERIRSEVAEASRRSGRKSDDVQIVAVTKKHSIEWIRPLIDAGATTLGENYPQELWEKSEALGDHPGVAWHLIGHLQSNKLRRTLPLVRFVHAIDSPRLLAALKSWLSGHPNSTISVCLQVNTSGEASKHGWAMDDVAGLCRALEQHGDGPHPGPIVGLMTIAQNGSSGDAARPMFERLRLLRDELQARTGRVLPHLSMGMSGDFAAAIAEGATLVRIGSALFEGVDEP